MIAGDPSAWTARFRNLDVRFLERVAAVWRRCLATLPDDPDEDTITINLVAMISVDLEARRLFHYLAFQHEPFGYTEEGWAYSKGKIDMALLLDRERERYLAYECKLLNVSRNGKKRSLATEYVTKGVARFISGQYAADLPLACMLGYVMDGNLDTAWARVCAAIAAHRTDTGLAWGPRASEPVGSMRRFSSGHCRASSGGPIEIRHALLPFWLACERDGG